VLRGAGPGANPPGCLGPAPRIGLNARCRARIWAVWPPRRKFLVTNEENGALKVPPPGSRYFRTGRRHARRAAVAERVGLLASAFRLNSAGSPSACVCHESVGAAGVNCCRPTRAEGAAIGLMCTSGRSSGITTTVTGCVCPSRTRIAVLPGFSSSQRRTTRRGRRSLS
jgi:hypothetical protein